MQIRITTRNDELAYQALARLSAEERQAFLPLLLGMARCAERAATPAEPRP